MYMTREEVEQQIKNTKSEKRKADLFRHLKKMMRKGKQNERGKSNC
jgi:hypothetical protein